MTQYGGDKSHVGPFLTLARNIAAGQDLAQESQQVCSMGKQLPRTPEWGGGRLRADNIEGNHKNASDRKDIFKLLLLPAAMMMAMAMMMTMMKMRMMTMTTMIVCTTTFLE